MSRTAMALLLFLLGCSGKNAAENISTETNNTEKKAESLSSLPVYQYYSKIPRVKGVTNDPVNLIFNFQVEVGYEMGDVKTLEKLSKFNLKIAGDLRQTMATRTKAYLGKLENYPEIERDILELINRIIAPNPKDPARIKDVIIVELQLQDYR